MSNRIKRIYDEVYTEEDVTQAQSRDFEDWTFFLKDDIQKLADRVNQNLSSKITKKDKVLVDITFAEIESLLEDAKRLLL